MPSQGSKTSVTVPDELRKKYPELVSLILGSESMNVEERQYWVNILPVMTPEQIGNLRQILQNEKDQLAAIDKKYSKEMKKLSGKSVEQMTQERREKKTVRRSKEEKTEREEKEKEEEILKAISEMDG